MFHGLLSPRYIECVNDCDDALQLDLTLVKLFIRKGKSLIKLGHLSNAEAVFTKVLSLSTSSFPTSNGHNHPHRDAVYQQLIESVKLEGKAGLRELEKLQKAIDTMITFETKGDSTEVLKIVENILKVSPHHRMSQITKCNTLLALNKYETCKEFIERLTITTYHSITVLYAHRSAIFPLPPVSQLEWKESSSSPGSIDYHPVSIVNMILCMGNELGSLYLHSIKNLPLNRIASAEMMNKMKYVLKEIEKLLSINDKDESWSWISKESSKLSELISLKISADQLFKNKSFQHALINYTNALKVLKLFFS
jgi:tetratricopeptide (TPR) repeat protein